MAKTLSRSTASRVFHRFFSTSTSRSVSPSPLPSNLISRRSSPSLFHLTRFTRIRTRMDSSCGSNSPLESESNFSDQPPTEEMAPYGLDDKHWHILFSKKPCGKDSNKQKILDYYVQILADIVGSKEEAKRMIYKLSCKWWYGFGCVIDDEKTLKRLRDLLEFRWFMLPDVYVDPEYKDYGGDLVVNGVLVPRSPERQRRITPKSDDGPLYEGCDHEHWNVEIKKPGLENATKQQMIDCYVETLAKIVGSEEKAKRKIYKVSCEGWFGFGCEIGEKTSTKLKDLPEVEFVFPDKYVDPVYNDYGGDLVVNGVLVPRPPERQRRIMIHESIINTWTDDDGGLDFKHWRINMSKKFGVENTTKQQMIDCYVQTLAKIVGSEEEAKRKIYKVSCEGWFGFGCEIDEKTLEKLEKLPEVGFVRADSYVDSVYKDYGAELFVNGEVVPRPPERQERIMVLNSSTLLL